MLNHPSTPLATAYRKRRIRAVQRPHSKGSGGYSAVTCLSLAAADVGSNSAPTYAPRIWDVIRPAGSPWKVGRDSVRWIDDPERIGLRFVGAAHSVDKGIGHTGWHVDSDGLDSIHGVVFQLPGKAGKARYMAGFSDAFNSESVCLSTEIIESESYSGAEDREAAREAAREADRLAERYAESEREYQEADRAGQKARHKAREAREAVSRAVQAVRHAREAFRCRNTTRDAIAVIRAARLPGMAFVIAALARHDSRVEARAAFREARAAVEHAKRKLGAARQFRDDSAPSKRWQPALFAAWQEGYDDAF